MPAPDDRSLAVRLAGGGMLTGRARLTGGALLAGAAVHDFPALAFHSRRVRDRLGVEKEVPVGDGRGGAMDDGAGPRAGCALTFDDGPHPQGTPAVLDALAAGGAHATFFLVGEQVQRNPGLAAEIAAAGHGIALHCHRHRNLLRLGPRQTRADILRAQAIVEEATDRAIGLYRPPYGILNATALACARRRGWRTLLWSHDGCDWAARATPESIAARVTSGVRPGSLLLLHDADDYSAPGSWRRTAAALPRVLDVLAEQGLSTISP